MSFPINRLATLVCLALFACDDSSGPEIVVDPGPPDLTAEAPLDLWGGEDVSTLGNLFVVASGRSLAVLDPWHSVNRVRQTRNTGAQIHRIAGNGDMLFFTARQQGLYRYRMTEADTLAFMSRVTGLDDATELVLDNGLLAVADRQVGVELYTTQTAAAPGPLGRIDLEPYDGQPEEILGLALDHPRLAVLLRHRGLVLYDIGNPADPVITGTRPGASPPLVRSGSWLCFMEHPDDGPAGLVVYNPLATGPTQSEGRITWQADSFLADLEPTNASVNNGTLYLGCLDTDRDHYPAACLLEVSLQNPTSPRLVGRLDLPGDWLPRTAATRDFLMLAVTYAPPRLYRR